MKKIILTLLILGIFHTVTGQVKKKTTSKSTTSGVSTKSKAAPKKATVSSKSKASKPVESKNSSVTTHFSKNDFQLNAGVGVSGWGTPIYVGADFGVADDISVGVEASYQSFKESYFLNDYNATIIGIGGNCNYHFGRILKTPKEWDLYAGLGLNYYLWSYDDNNYLGSNSSGIAIGGQVGVRYFFNKKFGINAELGGASVTSGAKIGITYKL